MRAFTVALLLALLTAPAGAQTIWSRPYQPNQIAVEALVPDVPDEASTFSGATFFTGTYSLNKNVELAAELPVARFGADATGLSSTTAIGNPYVGFGFSSAEIPLLFRIGARIPSAPSNAASLIGQTTDAGRTAAFEPDEFVLSSLLNGRFSLGRYSSLRLRAGIGYVNRPLPSATATQSRDQALRIHYDIQLWREGDHLITGFSFTGRETARLESSETKQHHAIFSVMGNWRRVQPGVVAGTSLNALFQNGEFAPIVGLTLSITYLR